MVATILLVIEALIAIGFLFYSLWVLKYALNSKVDEKVNYPDSEPVNIACMICARNESMVVGQLVDSLKKQDYPDANYGIFVVAHNCTDNTAEVAEAAGAEVFVRNNPEEKKKVNALQYGLDQVREKYGNQYTHYAVFDADALVHKDFLKEVNKAFGTGVDIVSGFYESKNFAVNTVTKLASTLYYFVMVWQNKPHNASGLPVNIYGSGYAVKMEYGVNLEEINTQVGDFEFTNRSVLQGAKSAFAPKAKIYAEMPITLKEALIQRKRWAIGHAQCSRKYRWKMFKGIKEHGAAARKQLIELLHIPLSAAVIIGFIICVIAMIIAGCWNPVGWGLLGLILYLFIFLSILCALALKEENRPVLKNLHVVLLMPVWIFLTPWYGFLSLFIRDVEWAETKRTSFTSIEDIQ